uniref:DNA (cytosine-5)-methyltransferase 3A-like isoform X1 n=1 Tax=Styela clava TaxID=7725 RepID=UPI00193A279D|nr:DNA (cytosine-5)-methyltransferase 3A-like isoform X1 [Styela clava]
MKRNRNKPDFFKIEDTMKKLKKDEKAKDVKVPHVNKEVKPLRRIILHENLLVWAKFKGIGWWPGRIADRKELSGPLDLPDEPTRWVHWFGDHKYSETHVDNIAAFHEFSKFYNEKKIKNSIAYKSAVTEALHEAAQRSGKKFENDTEMVEWALRDFLPGGYLAFMPKIKTDIINCTEVMTQNKNEDRTKKASHEQSSQSVESELLQQRNMMLCHVKEGRLKIQDICLGCGDQDVKASHPCFEGGLCNACEIDYTECMYSPDHYGCSSYCCVCSGGKEVLLCDEPDCTKCFCKDCITGMVGPQALKKDLLQKCWQCYLCREASQHGLLVRHANWKLMMDEISNKCDDIVYATILPSYALQNGSKKKIKVLSLFDGISTGMVALKELNFSIDEYYASEIDQNAIYISRAHHPEILHIGDIVNINNKELLEWGPFDLLIGGSPCNDLSIVNPARKGLWSEKGSGHLFFEFWRILNTCMLQASVHQKPFYWLFENVVHMDRNSKDTISRLLQKTPVLLDAKKVSPAQRPRLFWGNIPKMDRPLLPASDDRLTLQECMEPGRIALTSKIGTITTQSGTVSNKASLQNCQIMDSSEGQKDILWVTEIERIFGLPDHYTDKFNLSSSKRQKVLGKSWSVPVIKHLLTPLRDQFLTKT